MQKGMFGMKTSRKLISFTALILGFGATAARAESNPLTGRWDATVTVNSAVIPFRLDISGEGPTLKGTLFNGDDQETTTQASFENGTLVLNLEHYLTKIVATVDDGQLRGKIEMRGDKGPDGSPFSAVRHTAAPAANTANVPSIAGLWLIPNESPKGEKAWRFIARQSGADVSAAILRVDGDTGALTGTYQDGKFVLSHFDGSRALRVEVTPTKDGTLDIVQTGGGPRQGRLTAYRPEIATLKGLPEPANFATHTTVRDPNEIFTFSLPDVNGKILSNEDPKFKGKVVVAIVTGTWC